MPGLPFTLNITGLAEDAAELVEHFAAFVRDHEHHGITAASVDSPQYTGDPRDLPALDADPNSPLEATPAVAEPEDAAPATDETRDDLKDPGPTADDERAEQDRKAELKNTDVSRETSVPAPRPAGPLS